VLFPRDWGFAPSDVCVPVRWWHGAEDHFLPFRHGRHLDRLPDATMTVLDGESHLGGLGIAEEVIGTLIGPGSRRAPICRRKLKTLAYWGHMSHNGYTTTSVSFHRDHDRTSRRARWGRRSSRRR
jgi:hypothetical protein